MRYEELFSILDQARLSPERAAHRLGVSNMTLRRWRRRPPKDEVPAVYVRSFEPALRGLAGERKLSGGAARLSAASQEDFRDTLIRLGFPKDFMTQGLGDHQVMVNGLTAIGRDAGRKKEVDASRKVIDAFKKAGTLWKERITAMLAVIDSVEVEAADKLLAYGALFYLITPFDLIPDAIPIIGYLDDLAVLGIALWYYRGRLPRLVGAASRSSKDAKRPPRPAQDAP